MFSISSHNFVSTSRRSPLSQFYAHGRKNSTLTGYTRHVKAYLTPPQLAAVVPAAEADGADLTGKSIIVTGGNSGIGLSVATYCASKNADVILFCRSQERGDAAAEKIREETGKDSVRCVECDAGDKDSIDRAIEKLGGATVASLVCNAGVLNNERKVQKAGIEETAATHLIFGSYYLTKKILPSLASDGRVVYVSSGGMYNR